jgi:hypothetical protein
MRRTITAVLTLAAITSAQSARAFNDEAWRVFDAKVTKACLAARGIRNARPSVIVGFDDRDGMVAMLVSDRTKGSAMGKLCLFNKKTGNAFVDDVEMWSAPPQPK